VTFYTALLNKVLARQGVSLDNNLNLFLKAQKYLNLSKRHFFLEAAGSVLWTQQYHFVVMESDAEVKFLIILCKGNPYLAVTQKTLNTEMQNFFCIPALCKSSDSTHGLKLRWLYFLFHLTVICL